MRTNVLGPCWRRPPTGLCWAMCQRTASQCKWMVVSIFIHRFIIILFNRKQWFNIPIAMKAEDADDPLFYHLQNEGKPCSLFIHFKLTSNFLLCPKSTWLTRICDLSTASPTSGPRRTIALPPKVQSAETHVSPRLPYMLRIEYRIRQTTNWTPSGHAYTRREWTALAWFASSRTAMNNFRLVRPTNIIDLWSGYLIESN